MGKIVAIGGAKLKKKDTLAIDREIIRLSGKKHPKVLFIPTASSDSEEYSTTFENYYGKFLGCKTDVLLLTKQKYTKAEIEKKILSSDIVYVGGGNTLMMIRVWKKLGVDRILKKAYEKGIVLSGVSAGGICWFEAGHSDSMSFYNPKKWKYIKVGGLGFFKGIFCPHYDSNTLSLPRKTYFQKMIQKTGGIGIAVDEKCALEFIDGKYRVINSKKSAGAYRVYKQKGEVVSEKIEQTSTLMPISHLYQAN